MLGEDAALQRIALLAVTEATSSGSLVSSSFGCCSWRPYTSVQGFLVPVEGYRYDGERVR